MDKCLILIVIMTSLSQLPGSDVDQIMKEICDSTLGITVNEQGIKAGVDKIVALFGDKSESKVIDYIGDFSKDGELLIGAVESLKYLGTEKSRDTLIEALGHLPSGMMHAASTALARLDIDGLADYLSKLELSEKDEDRKTNLSGTMCNLSGAKQYATVLRWAKSDGIETRKRGISSLKNYSTEEGKQIVRRALFDENEAVRFLAMETMGRIGDQVDVTLFQYLYIRASKKTGLDLIGEMSAIKSAVEGIKGRMGQK